MLASARVTPLFLRSSASMAKSSSRFFSIGMENGSILQGDAQSALCRRLGSHVQLLRFHGRGGPGNIHRSGRTGLDALAREIVGGREAECAIGDHPNADAQRLRVRGLADLAVLGGQRAMALIHDASFGQRRAAQFRRLQRP